MYSYQIITDSCCDFTDEQCAQLNISRVPLTFLFRDQTLDDPADTRAIQEFYNAMRAGENATTSAVNPDRWASAMEQALSAGKDVLVLAFSSGLSTTYQSAMIAAEELIDKYPARKIRVVDTLAAALGQGLLVWYACKKRDEGMDLDELAGWVEENKLHLCHWVTVDDLDHLKRGGRISTATALVGGMLNIKPIIHVDNEGKLINVGKVRGRKAAMEHLVKKMQELGEGYDNSTVFLSHGDCLEDAQEVARMLKEKCGVQTVQIGYVGAVIGSHTGPGVLALFFMGKNR